MKNVIEKRVSETLETSSLTDSSNPIPSIANAGNDVGAFGEIFSPEVCEYDDNLSEEMSPDYVRPREVIRAAEEELIDKIWFSRNTRFAGNEKGEYVLVPLFPESAPAVKELLKKYGSQEALLPADEFESGMLNGKLSALRWVLGWEWDFLGI